jgi:hypothetical protein
MAPRQRTWVPSVRICAGEPRWHFLALQNSPPSPRSRSGARMPSRSPAAGARPRPPHKPVAAVCRAWREARFPSPCLTCRSYRCGDAWPNSCVEASSSDIEAGQPVPRCSRRNRADRCRRQSRAEAGRSEGPARKAQTILRSARPSGETLLWAKAEQTSWTAEGIALHTEQAEVSAG